MTSIFTDKRITPSVIDLTKALGTTFSAWQSIVSYTQKAYPQAIEEWHFSSVKYGWGFRIKDKKRVIVYLLPRDGFFKVALVFGQKATDQVLQSDVAETIQSELRVAKIYAEGRGIRIEVKDASLIKDIEQLISIKIAN